jgi:hypothetical protein
MNVIALLAPLLVALPWHPGSAQVVPTTPTEFTKRATGAISSGGGSASIGLAPGRSAHSKPLVKQVSYIALSDARQWTSTDGKTLVGKLIAFEQSEQVLTDGQTTSTTSPKLPARPTLIREGNVRLLVQQKPFEFALSRLSKTDQDFIQTIDQAIARKAASPEAK